MPHQHIHARNFQQNNGQNKPLDIYFSEQTKVVRASYTETREDPGVGMGHGRKERVTLVPFATLFLVFMLAQRSGVFARALNPLSPPCIRILAEHLHLRPTAFHLRSHGDNAYTHCMIAVIYRREVHA